MQAAMPAEYVLLCTRQDRIVVFSQRSLLLQVTAVRARTMCQSDAVIAPNPLSTLQVQRVARVLVVASVPGMILTRATSLSQVQCRGNPYRGAGAFIDTP